jgi:hypothetical protein
MPMLQYYNITIMQYANCVNMMYLFLQLAFLALLTNILREWATTVHLACKGVVLVIR